VAARNELRLESLLGRAVRDPGGRIVGRIEEFRAEREGEHWVVRRYHLGPAGLLERLAVRHLNWLPRPRPQGYVVAWDQLSLDDPKQPRLTCDVSELREITPH
jgi:hypothetical protein